MTNELASLASIVSKDFLIGFFMALALRRGRIQTILDTILPVDSEKS